jgi:hypothetical protein
MRWGRWETSAGGDDDEAAASFCLLGSSERGLLGPSNGESDPELNSDGATRTPSPHVLHLHGERVGVRGSRLIHVRLPTNLE